MNIHVYIERLIVDGLDFGTAGAHEFQSAMENRLTQLLTEHGLPSDLDRMASVPVATAPTLSVTHRIDGATFGTRAAESLHGGMVHQTTSALNA